MTEALHDNRSRWLQYSVKDVTLRFDVG